MRIVAGVLGPARRFVGSRARTIQLSCPWTHEDRISKTGDSELDPLIGLFAFLIADIGFATVTEYRQGVRFEKLLAYYALGFIALWTMCLIVSRQRPAVGTETTDMYELNLRTVHVGRWLVMCATIIMVSFVAFASFGRWIGQAPLPPTVSKMELVAMNDGTPAIRLDVKIKPEHFGGRVPNTCTLTTQLSPETQQQVELKTVEMYRIVDGVTERVDEPAIAIRNPQLANGRTRTEVKGLTEADSRYLAELYLPIKGQPKLEPAKNEKEAMSGEKAILDSLNNASRTAYDKAKDEIIYKGNIYFELE